MCKWNSSQRPDGQAKGHLGWALSPVRTAPYLPLPAVPAQLLPSEGEGEERRELGKSAINMYMYISVNDCVSVACCVCGCGLWCVAWGPGNTPELS